MTNVTGSTVTGSTLATHDDRAVTDLYPVARRLLIEIVVRALFGERLIDRTAEIDDKFTRSQRYLSTPLYRQIPHPVPFTLRAGVRADRQALDEMIDAAIATSRTEPATDDEREGGIDHLFSSRHSQRRARDGSDERHVVGGEPSTRSLPSHAS